MKIVCISDTHGEHDALEMPRGDVLIHAGDFTQMGREKEVIAFNDWLAKQPYAHKIVIAGNHDFLFQDDLNYARVLLPSAIYLQDQAIEINGLSFYGSPWTPKFYDWAFMHPRHSEEIKQVWSWIPHKLDVLITHGPPKGILDENSERISCGCPDLYARVRHEVNPRYHIFGHIHESHGTLKIEGTTFVNASMLTNSGVKKPIVLDV